MAGRPSKAPERRDHILDAMEICVRDRGIAHASLRQIADQSGLSLQMVSHYFGNRHALVLAFVTRVVARLTTALDEAGYGATDHERLLNTIHFLCDGRYKALAGNDVIGREIWGLAERDDDVRLIVWDAYEAGMERTKTLLRKAYPGIDKERCHCVAYAILCLTEANEFFSGISRGTIASSLTETIILDLLRGLETATKASAGS
ncbi:MAG: TetR/AcrR family transcriptional regulator [Parvibaculum sp.]